MRWITLSRSSGSYVFAGAAALLLAGGCAHVNNPFQDSGAAIDADMRTPSSEAYARARDAAPARPQRSWPAATVAYRNGATTHWPLWFQDPFEDRGNTDQPMLFPEEERDLPDNRFAWNWVDYLHIAYGPGRELLNIAGWPVSAVVTPPGTLLESDGRISPGLLGYDHDPKKADSVRREPPHVSLLSDIADHGDPPPLN
jgi:hypothetical protein